MAGLPYVPDSHDTCDPSPGERGGLEEKIRDRLSTGAPLIAVKEWDMGSLADLPGKSLWRVSCVARLGLSVSSERSCHPHLGPFPSTTSEGSARAPDVELVGYLIVCQPGPACSRLLNKQRRSGGFPYSPPT